MKKILLLFTGCTLSAIALAQASGIGYYLGIGGCYSGSASGFFSQEITSISHNGFIRFHSKNTLWATQFVGSYRRDFISYQNFSEFIGSNSTEVLRYNTDAQIDRSAWRITVVEQLQLGSDKSRFCVALNPGLFYERTLQASRSSEYDSYSYDLRNEINPNGVGWTLGAEVRFHWLTLGYKVEQQFTSVLNHDYLLSQPQELGTSSELRSLVLNPAMNYVFVGINLDFYE